jgi:N-acyl-L-homoserine lactone synthetase
MAKKAFLCGVAGALVDFYKLRQKIFSKALEWKWFLENFL